MQESETPTPQNPPEEHLFSWQRPAQEEPVAVAPSATGNEQASGEALRQTGWDGKPPVQDPIPPPRYGAPPILGPQAEPSAPRPPQDSPFQKRLKQMGPIGVALATLIAKLKTFGSAILFAAKFAKLGKIAVTLVSMIVSIGAYTLIFGFPFAVGFVVLIFVHEMGHVYVAWRQGTPVTAPLFVPFMGAVIFSKRGGDSAWAQAIMGIGGPVAGGLGALACLGVYFATGNLLFLALASVTFFMNLFNLMPIVPLDGGWIVGAVSPWLWLVGLVGLVAMTFLGHMTNPMVWVLVILSLPRVWSLFRPSADRPAGILRPPTMPQRLIMGVCYFSLAGALMLGLGFSHGILDAWRESRHPARVSPQVAMRWRGEH